MARRIIINRLDKEDLTYELTIRGIGLGNVDEMRRRLSVAFQMERSGDSLKYPKYPFSFEEDYKAVTDALEDLKSVIFTFEQSRKTGEALKVQSKLAHVLGRLDNMVIENAEESQKKSVLLALALSLTDDFNTKLDNFDQKIGVVPPIIEAKEKNLENNTFDEDFGNVSKSSAIGDLNRPSTSGSIKSVPPNKWNLKYSGNLREMSLSAFLERVEELRIARCISK